MSEVIFSGHYDLVSGGQLARYENLIYPVTACCNADAKGSGTGVVCRGCYAPLPDEYGMAFTVGNFREKYPDWCQAKQVCNEAPAALAAWTDLVLGALA